LELSRKGSQGNREIIRLNNLAGGGKESAVKNTELFKTSKMLRTLVKIICAKCICALK